MPASHPSLERSGPPFPCIADTGRIRGRADGAAAPRMKCRGSSSLQHRRQAAIPAEHAG